MYLKKKIAREISFIIVEVTIAPSSSHHHRNRHFHKMSGRQQKTFLFPKLVTRTCTRIGYTFLVQICYAKKVLPEKKLSAHNIFVTHKENQHSQLATNEILEII